MAETKPESADPPVPPASKFWLIAPAVALALLPFLSLILDSQHEPANHRTSYDASADGFRGVYLVLEELGYPVERTRKKTGGTIRWILFPAKATDQEASAVNTWIQEGGCALLAVENARFAEQLGLTVKVQNGPEDGQDQAGSNAADAPATPRRASAPGVRTVYAGPLQVKGPSGGRTWGRIDGQPIVTIYQRGKGQLWLLNRPDVLINDNVRDGDNAVLACRLADEMLQERPKGRIAFDEYCHGLHDRPSVYQLIFRRPALYVTLEALLLLGLALWHYGIRFGSLRPAPPPARRSKEEFLNAMAALLARKGDYGDAFRTVRDAFLLKLEKELGLSAGTPLKQVIREAKLRRNADPNLLRDLLTARTPPQGAGAAAFLNALHLLETAADECFQSRTRPRKPV